MLRIFNSIESEALLRGCASHHQYDAYIEDASYWDRRSKMYENMAKTSSYAEKLILKMRLSEEDSVLDIGCGTGILAVPLAEKVRSVTALDMSEGMLNILRNKIVSKGIDNIDIISSSWEDATPLKHDIVLASRCLSWKDIEQSLLKMNDTARHSVFVILRTADYNDYKATVSRLQNKDYIRPPEYEEVVKILSKLGINAKVHFFDSFSEETYSNSEETIRHITQGEKLTEIMRYQLSNFVESNFEYSNGKYHRKRSISWAMIKWNSSADVTKQYLPVNSLD